ncbi:ribosome-recycling factor, mitochondrial [Trichomonascus vanleenenianus]|uniref:Rrf1p n=1 Tax=Trichomonascus vanleenenianus TaxID=2268995 RepID=UPI003ECB286D
MLRFTVRRQAVGPAMVTSRLFSASAVALGKKTAKKGNKKGSAAEENGAVDPNLKDSKQFTTEVKQLDDRFKDTLKQFLIRANEAKQGKANLAKIGALRVQLSSDESAQELKSLANIQIKNNNKTIVLTVFDPKHVKYIQTAVLADLGVTPQLDMRNEQVITVTMPTRTADAKKELSRQIKHEYEHFRNSPSRHSLTFIREDLMKHLKKSHFGKAITDDEFKTFNQKVEKVFKKYSDELLDAFKKSEQSL